MISYPNIDPVIVRFGPLQVRWYGLMYVLGFIATYFLVKHQISRYRLKTLAAHFENLNFVLIISLVVGGRLGYVLFYNLTYYLQHPAEILATWQGGMSFHGALLGILCGGYLYCRKKNLDFLQTADIYVVTIPIGLGFGRLGNFINGELFGRTTSVPWAMIFPAGGPQPRHPSQLYECLLEGLLLFIILWSLKNKYWQRSWPSGTMFAFFLVLYGVFRWFAELFREPDAHIGFVFSVLTRGQILSGLMIVAGCSFLFLKRKEFVRL